MFQIGGNDQMGNIMSGQELISRMYDKQVFGKSNFVWFIKNSYELYNLQG